MTTTDDYLALVTSEHRDKPKYTATVVATFAGPTDENNVLLAMPPDFDVDLAVGSQLDAVGLWANVARVVTVIPSEAFPAAAPYAVNLDDATFRRLIKARVQANKWNGTPSAILAILQAFYASRGITATVFDNQDMSIDIYLTGGNPTDAEAAVLAQMILPVRPAGVRINNHYISPAGPLFGLDTENAIIAGPDVGAFGKVF